MHIAHTFSYFDIIETNLNFVHLSQNLHILCAFKSKLAHTLCTFKPKCAHTLCANKACLLDKKGFCQMRGWRSQFRVVGITCVTTELTALMDGR